MSETMRDPGNHEVNAAAQAWFDLLSSDWIDYVGGNKLDAAKEGFRHGYVYGHRAGRATAQGEVVCPLDCIHRAGRSCVLSGPNHCVRRAEDYYTKKEAGADLRKREGRK